LKTTIGVNLVDIYFLRRPGKTGTPNLYENKYIFTEH